MFRMTDRLPEREPTKRDLAEIEAEWPAIAAGLVELDTEIWALTAPAGADELAVRRERRSRRRVLRAASSPGSWGGGEAA